MIEFVFSASPETIRSEPRECAPRPVGYRRDLAACALMNPDFLLFPYGKRFLRCCLAAELFGRHKVLLSAFDREHVADHLPGNG